MKEYNLTIAVADDQAMSPKEIAAALTHAARYLDNMLPQSREMAVDEQIHFELLLLSTDPQFTFSRSA